MYLHVETKSRKNINRTPVLQQTSFWSELKRQQGIVSKTFDITVKADDIYFSSWQTKYVRDDVLVLFQEDGNGGKIGYVPYGPTIEPCEESQGAFLEELSESLRPYLDDDCIALRYDLIWESPWARDTSRYVGDDWLGPPARKNQEIRLNFNTCNWNLKKANTNILPKDTVFVDLRSSEKNILQTMKAKTRYNIGLARRRGVQVRRAELSDLDIWYDLYRETCARNHIYLHDLNYFTTVLSTKANDSRSPADVELLIAEYDGCPLAAIFLVYSATRATYLYGASSSSHRHVMAPYLLQWRAMQCAKSKGCSDYDMFGVAPSPDPAHAMYGLYRFKTGFGGYLFHRMGCWDYPMDQKRYEVFRSLEMKSQGYHLN